MEIKPLYPQAKEIWLIDFPSDNGCVIRGYHKAIVLQRFGTVCLLVPLSSKCNNIHPTERLIVDDGFKVKLKSQIVSLDISTNRFVKYERQAPEAYLNAICDFLRLEILKNI